jgi:hypothetical protein
MPPRLSWAPPGPSLRKAFTRHGLGMPARHPEAVRQRALAAANQRGGSPTASPLDPVFVALTPASSRFGVARILSRGCGCAGRGDRDTQLPHRGGANAESRLASQRRVATIIRRADRGHRLAGQRTSRGKRCQADRASRTDRPPPTSGEGVVTDAR